MDMRGIVFVVDDDARIRDSLHNLLLAVGHQVRAYEDAKSFLAAPKPDAPCCVILDLNLGRNSGLEVQTHLNRDASLPVIFLTGCGDIPTAVKAMRAGACDFLTKPIMQDELLLAVNSALFQAGSYWGERRAAQEIRRNYLTLTPRERDVLPFIVRGFLNKQTAYELGTSEITIRIHRGRIMQKMKAESLAQLVRLAGRLGIPQESETTQVPEIGKVALAGSRFATGNGSRPGLVQDHAAIPSAHEAGRIAFVPGRAPHPPVCTNVRGEATRSTLRAAR